MAQLANRRHELFCLEVASGAPLATASGYREGRGYDCRHNASRLRNQPHVKERINEILAQSAERAVVGLGWVQLQLLDVANGKVPSKTVTNSKGEKEETFDRAGALSTLDRTLGAGADVAVSVNASAQASSSAEIDVKDMSSAELARRVSWVIEQAALESGDVIDAELAYNVHTQASPPALPPPKERARRAIVHSIELARDLCSDLEALRYFHASLVELTHEIAKEVAAHG